MIKSLIVCKIKTDENSVKIVRKNIAEGEPR